MAPASVGWLALSELSSVDTEKPGSSVREEGGREGGRREGGRKGENGLKIYLLASELCDRPTNYITITSLLIPLCAS